MAGQCQGQNKDGAACSATPQRDRAWCVWHDPLLATRRQAWSIEGGRNKSTKARARRELGAGGMELTDVAAILSRLLRRLEAGQAEPSICSAAANLARALSDLEKTTTVERRLAELEAIAGVGRRA